jgi:uncharacterized protein (TIGR00369 family)
VRSGQLVAKFSCNIDNGNSNDLEAFDNNFFQWQEVSMTISQQIAESFNRQGYLQTIGARLTKVASGEIEIELATDPKLTQQHGYVHGAVVAAIGDTACGYAALTMMPENSEVVSVEYKINFMAPAKGEKLIARGRVNKAGRTLSVCTADIFAVNDGEEKVVATVLATMMRVVAGNS